MKKFSAIILCFLFLITCGFAGCAGFSVNRVKYYNEVIATVGTTNITRYDLLTAYNSYGNSYYVSQLGKSEEEAFAETLDVLMDRESLYQYAHGKTEYKPTAYQVNTAIEELFSSMDSSMETYVKQAKRVLNIKITDSTDDSDKETAYKYADYDTRLVGKRAELRTKTVYYTTAEKTIISATPTEYSELVDYIAYVEKDEPSFACVLGSEHEDALTNFEAEETLELIIDSYLAKFYKSLEEEKSQDAIYNKAISLLAQDLISSEKYLRDSKGKAYNTVTKDLLTRYFRKMYNDKIKTLYLTNVRTNYLKNATDELSINALLDKYVSLVETSYNKYANFASSYKNDMKNASTNADDILYHPVLDDAKFGYFVHCLIKFDDNQTANIKSLENYKKANPTMTDDAYNDAYYSIIEKTKAVERDSTTGLVTVEKDATDNPYDLNKILEEYRKVENLDQFISFMFRFSEDTATLKQGMPYVVGTNGNSAMETAFTDEAVRLMTEGNPGDMTPATTNTDSKNGVTMCITSYGIHFLYYIGEVNMFDIPFGEIEDAYISTRNKAGNNYNLYLKEINPLTHETYFDMLFDKVYPATSSSESYASSTGYDAKEDAIIQEIRKSNPVKVFETKLKATKSSL